jgi:hypothetical protein
MFELHRWQAVVVEATQAWLETIVNGSSSCGSSSGASACVARGSHLASLAAFWSEPMYQRLESPSH